MPTLSSILVQRDVATMRAVEEAIARQVLHGGDLPTNLLELGATDESRLIIVVAESFGMTPGPAGKLRQPEPAVLRMVPGELALRHGIFPVALDERTLWLATFEPLSPAIEDDLAFALDVVIHPVLVPLVRIRQAIADNYGIPLDRRLLRLIARLDGRPDPSPSSLPPALRQEIESKKTRLLGTISIPAPNFGTGVPESNVIRTPAQISTVSDDVRAARIPSTPGIPGDLEAAVARAESEPPPASVRPKRRDMKALAGFVRRALKEERDVPRGVPIDANAGMLAVSALKRRFVRPKGPFTATTAERELENAGSIDAVLEVTFAFIQQYFEYSALFVVHGESASGRDGFGPGADRAKVASVKLALDRPGLFAMARERRAAVLARPEQDLDREIAGALERGRAPSKNVVALPILVRNRAVALIWGDDGDRDVSLAAIGDVISFVGLAGAAVERLALRRKKGGDVAAEATGARETRGPAPRGAMALARALELPGTIEEEPTRESPALQVSPGAESIRAPEAFEQEYRTRDYDAAAFSEPDALPHDDENLEDADTFADDRHEQGEVLAEDSGDDMEKALTRAVGPSDRAKSEPPALPYVSKPTPTPAALRRRTVLTRIGVQSKAQPSTMPGMQASPPPLEQGLVETTLAFVDDGNDVRSRHANVPVPAVALPRAHEGRPIRREDSVIPPAPASESTGVVSARPMETARTPIPPQPSVIVDVGAEYASLVQRVIEGGVAGSAAFEHLAKHGEQAISFVMARFPGPLRVDRHRMRDQLPLASQCGPLLDLVVTIRRPALPFITTRTSSPDVDLRFWATHVLGELRYPEAANVLVPRLFDDDVAVRRVARHSAAALASSGDAGKPLLLSLENMTRNTDQPIPHRVLAIETMGEIRTNAMVPPLVAVLLDPSEDVAEAARRALLSITRQDFGREARRWSEWWSKNATRHRIEWLIDALMHEQAPIRRAAADELKQITKEYFGYYDDLPKKERERAQLLYRGWWEKEGRIRFS